MRLFIAGFTPSTTERDLRPLFEEFGEVIDLVVMKDRNSGQSRCFGFAEMDDASGAKAMHGLDGMRMNGRRLAVTVAQPRTKGSGRRD